MRRLKDIEKELMELRDLTEDNFKAIAEIQKNKFKR